MKILFTTMIAFCVMTVFFQDNLYCSKLNRYQQICEDLFSDIRQQLAEDELIVTQIRTPGEFASLWSIDVDICTYTKSMYAYEEGRNLFDATATKIEKIVNNNKKIRPYLSRFPFVNGVTIEIVVLNPSTNEVVQYPKIARMLRKDSAVAVLCSKDGKVFSIKDVNKL